MYWIKRIYHPEVFQGVNKRRRYFEGWYFKLIDKGLDHGLAVIPGVSLEGKGEGHSFIQVLDARNHRSYYMDYPVHEFNYCRDKFEIGVGPNYFSQNRMVLNIHGKELSMEGNLVFKNITNFPRRLLRPGIMGPYSFVPFMECYHGIVSIHHSIQGKLRIFDEEIDFNEGYGYIEKDWGRSFPENWIWFQSNHFGGDDVTIMFSVAKIPWLGSSFTGFISFIRIKRRIYLFATYTKAELVELQHNDQRVKVVLEDAKYRLDMEVHNGKGSLLKAPKHGFMNRDILESIDGEVDVQFSQKNGKMIYQGKGTRTGFECHQ